MEATNMKRFWIGCYVAGFILVLLTMEGIHSAFGLPTRLDTHVECLKVATFWPLYAIQLALMILDLTLHNWKKQ